MKRTGLLFLVTFILLTAINAHGAVLNYNLGTYSNSMAPGTMQVIPVIVTMGPAGGSNLNLQTMAMSSGNMPMGWVTAVMPVVPIVPGVPTNANLLVSVPGNALPGDYNRRVLSMVMGSMEPVDPGQGVLISVTVTGNAGCQEKPMFNDTVIEPDVMKVRNNRLVDIHVKGSATKPDGCTLKNVRYEIKDEYGTESGGENIAFDEEEGSFDTTIRVEASRKGSDEDGRLYKLILFAENEVGEGESSVFEIRVAHDSRAMK